MKRSIKNTCLFFIFHFLVSFSFSQQSKIDSLIRVLKTAKEDTNRVFALNDLGWEYKYNNPDTSYLILKQALALAQKINYKKGIATTMENIGGYNLDKADYTKALYYYFGALKINKELKYKGRIAKTLGNIGIVYYGQADYSKALEYYFKALKMDEEVGRKSGIATNLGNIGNIYSAQGDYTKSLEYYFKALKLNKELGDKNRMSIIVGNIGIVYYGQADYSKALEYYFKALKMAEELGHNNGISECLSNMGVVYKAQANYSKALEFYFKALKIDEQLGNKSGSVAKLANIGLLYSKIGSFSKSEKYLKKSLTLCYKIGALDYTRDVEKSLSQLYDTTGRHKLALEHYKKYIAARDSITNEENTKKQVQQEMQYNFDKQQTADSIKTAERANQEKLKHNQEIHQQKIYTYGGIIGFGLMLIVAFVSFRAFRNKQKANLIIAHQKELVEEKQKEILDSIHYAKRIQQALLPAKKYIDKQLRKLNE